jgi:hypothetical protein
MLLCRSAAVRASSEAVCWVSVAPEVTWCAASATPVMLSAVLDEPSAAWPTLRAISAVVAVCSSTAAAIVVA